MRQITWAFQGILEKYERKGPREQCLETMESTVPWGELEALIDADR
jgi:hypothetical protein